MNKTKKNGKIGITMFFERKNYWPLKPQILWHLIQPCGGGSIKKFWPEVKGGGLVEELPMGVRLVNPWYKQFVCNNDFFIYIKKCFCCHNYYLKIVKLIRHDKKHQSLLNLEAKFSDKTLNLQLLYIKSLNFLLFQKEKCLGVLMAFLLITLRIDLESYEHKLWKHTGIEFWLLFNRRHMVHEEFVYLLFMKTFSLKITV